MLNEQRAVEQVDERCARRCDAARRSAEQQPLDAVAGGDVEPTLGRFGLGAHQREAELELARRVAHEERLALGVKAGAAGATGHLLEARRRARESWRPSRR